MWKIFVFNYRSVLKSNEEIEDIEEEEEAKNWPKKKTHFNDLSLCCSFEIHIELFMVFRNDLSVMIIFLTFLYFRQ